MDGVTLTVSGLDVEVHRILFHLQFIVLPSLFICFIVVSKRSVLPRWTHSLFFIAFLAYVWYLFRNHQSGYRTGSPWLDYSLGSTLGFFIFNALHLLVLVDPLEEYWHKTRPRPSEWKARVYWVWQTIVSLRGFGWNYQIHNLPATPKAGRDRLEYCFYALRQSLLHLYLVDVMQNTIRTVPFLRLSNIPLDSNSSTIYSFLLWCIQRFARVAVWFFGGYAGICFYYYTVALICVGSGYSEAGDWPKVFGNLKEAYSLRNFWGRTWHQLIRRFCISLGRKGTRLFDVAPRSLTAALIKLYIAFLASALMHSFGDYMVGQQYIGVSFGFFFLQPFAIIFEELVQLAARQVMHPQIHRTSSTHSASFEKFKGHPGGASFLSLQTRSIVARVIGYLWVVFWFTATTPLMIDAAIEAGFVRDSVFPFSPTEIIVTAFRSRWNSTR
ncbi:membrane bound O-acyl transferase family-domain-containing protein [Lentinula raphanica]|nr:membrane bound O-acyl transferase family-domain-containing protein [Lentinula raphanica]